MTTLPTRNADWGFHGTIRHQADPEAAWPLAFAAVARATQGSPEGVRDFLDSRHGRHFADDVANGLARGKALQHAIDAAVTCWMGWTIDPGWQPHTVRGAIAGALKKKLGLNVLSERDDTRGRVYRIS